MKQQNKIKIQIINWDRYNPRNDLKSMNWFRVENKLPEHPAFFELTNNGKWFFIWLLCQCAKQMIGEVTLDLTYCQHYSGVSKKEIPEILQVLERYELIRNVHVTDTNENVPNRQTDVQTDRQVLVAEDYYNFWNEYIKNYPNKKGLVSLSGARINKIKKANIPLDKFKLVVQKAFQSSFLVNECKPFGFDWLFQTGKNDNIENWVKVLEGKYDDNKPQKTKSCIGAKPV